MYTTEKVVEVLDKLGVREEELSLWESGYDISIPKDPQGKKLYNENHIKLFKSIKKLLALGYSSLDIKKKLNLDRKESLKAPLKTPQENVNLNKAYTNPMKAKVPVLPGQSAQQANTIQTMDNLPLIKLIERLMDEKNQLNMDKNYLLEQIHLLEMQEQELSKTNLENEEKINTLTSQVEVLEEQALTNVPHISAEQFLGSWAGKAKLIKTVFDTLDIDIPKERNKLFKVTDLPKRLYANLAVFMSSFKCDEDPLWERIETYRVVYVNSEELQGELDVEYFVDNVSVAKAIYSITCTRRK